MHSSSGTTPRTIGYGWILFALVLAESASAFESAMVFVAIPHMMTDFQADVAAVGWVVTAFYLIAAITAGICGRLGDLFGRKRLVVVLLLFSAVGSLVSLIGDNLTMVIIGRGIQGVAGAVMPLVVALARQTAPPGRANSGIGAVAATAVVAGSVGYFVAGFLVDAISWHAIFVFSTVLAFAATAVVAFLVPKDERVQAQEGERIDWLGAGLFAVSVGLILYGITSANSWGWTSSGVLGLIAAGLVLLAVFIAVELRTETPLIQVRVFTQRHLALTLFATIAIAGCMGGLGTITSIVMQGPTSMPLGLGLSATVAGAISGGSALLAYLTSPILGRMSSRFGGRSLLLCGSIMAFANLTAFVLLHDSLPGFLFVQILSSLATLYLYSSLPILVAESVPEKRMGEVTGAQVVLRTAMTSVASAVTSAVLATSTVAGTTMPDVTGMQRNILAVAIWTVPAFLIAFLLRRRQIEEAERPGEPVRTTAEAAT
ncbi:MFS transporter [Streptosporangium amethystogenes]|uniref:MFS transporter n=1 Tax=Streptosporangium amethystogenes TaxID=2002 RepID=UPI00379F05C8